MPEENEEKNYEQDKQEDEDYKHTGKWDKTRVKKLLAGRGKESSSFKTNKKTKQMKGKQKTI